MLNDLELAQQKQRERLRWRILKIAYAGLTLGVGENLLLAVLGDTGHVTTRQQVRDQLAYLEGKTLLRVDRERADWRVIISPLGVDVAEGTAVCPAGLQPEV